MDKCGKMFALVLCDEPKGHMDRHYNFDFRILWPNYEGPERRMGRENRRQVDKYGAAVSRGRRRGDY
jgi:hypothetical protein